MCRGGAGAKGVGAGGIGGGGGGRHETAGRGVRVGELWGVGAGERHGAGFCSKAAWAEEADGGGVHGAVAFGAGAGKAGREVLNTWRKWRRKHKLSQEKFALALGLEFACREIYRGGRIEADSKQPRGISEAGGTLSGSGRNLETEGGLVMENEQIQPLPLSGQEVKDAILFKVQESLSHSCHLHFDNAYSSFKAEISIKLTLADYGREVRDNHIVKLEEDRGVAQFPDPDNSKTVESNLVVEPMPPNQVRVETGQSVPVATVIDGKQKIRHVKYAVRKAKE